jgi:membrane fusion protein (multidrug efflux system)
VGKGQPTLLATISTLDPIWFYCAFSEVDYLRADRMAQETGRRVRGLPVQLILADGSEFPDQGQWVFLDRAVDVTTGTLRARAEFPNPRKVLRPGMFGRVRISLKTENEGLLVPERAVQELQGKNFVWVVGDDDKAAQRPVKVGADIGSDKLILEGLKAGERVVVEGVQKVREGAPVKPLTAAQLAEAAAQAAQRAAAEHAASPAAKPGAAKHGKE